MAEVQRCPRATAIEVQEEASESKLAVERLEVVTYTLPLVMLMPGVEAVR
jgi:hypothetical protein